MTQRGADAKRGPDRGGQERLPREGEARAGSRKRSASSPATGVERGKSIPGAETLTNSSLDSRTGTAHVRTAETSSVERGE